MKKLILALLLAGQAAFGAQAKVTTASIVNGAVTNAKQANMANGTVKCRSTAGTGSPEDCTAVQTQAIVGSVPQVLSQQSTPSTPGAGLNKLYFKSDNKLYTLDSAGNEVEVGSGGGGGGGSVTSVGLSDASSSPIYSISGSPVTGSGTLSLTLQNQDANKVFAGPSTGSPAQPAFRSLVAADVPTLNQDTTGTAASAPAVISSIAQTSHGLSIGDVIRCPTGAGSCVKAQADTKANAEVFGIVSLVPDANHFSVTKLGTITGLSGLTADATGYLSPTTPGAITFTEPTTPGQVWKPIINAQSTSAGEVLNRPGVEITAAAGGMIAFGAFGSMSGTTTSSSFADPGSVTGSLSSTTASGITCTTASSLVGQTCTITKTGTYEICASGFTAISSSPQNSGVAMFDDGNVQISGRLNADYGYANALVPYGFCTHYAMTATGSRTFKMRGLASSGTLTLTLAQFSIKKVN